MSDRDQPTDSNSATTPLPATVGSTHERRRRSVGLTLAVIGASGLVAGFDGLKIPLGFAELASPFLVFGGAFLLLGGLHVTSKAAHSTDGRRIARRMFVWAVGIGAAALAGTGSVFIVLAGALGESDPAATGLAVVLCVATCAGLAFGIVALTRRHMH